MRSKIVLIILGLGLIGSLAVVGKAAPMGTAWTYQGRLMDANNPADGLYDFEFKLYDDPYTGIQEGSTFEVNDVDVIDGYFTVELDFGSDVFDGDACWLDISVRPGNSTSSFTSLGPLQRITSTPYSLQTRGIFVDNEGNVGMGTTSPEQELHVYQPVRNVYVRAESDGGFAFFQVDGTKNSGLRIEEDGTLKANVYWNTASQCLSLAYGNDDSLVVKGENIGIGTQDPSNDLHIYDSTSNCYVDAESETGYAFFQADGHRNSGLTIKENGTVKANVYWNTANESLSMAEGGAERLVVKSGNVGIGTNLPAEKLHVAGNLKVNGTITNGPGNIKAPIAYGAINADGTVLSASPNVSNSFWNNTLYRYEITISGESLDTVSYVFNVTYINLNVPRFITASAENGRLIVEIWSPGSTKASGRFHFVVYKI